MHSVHLALFLLAGTIAGLASKSKLNTILRIYPNPDVGDYELNAIQRGPLSEIMLKTKDGESVTEILSINTILRIYPNPDVGDYEMNAIQKGPLSAIMLKTKDGESVTDILAINSFEVAKPSDADSCYVTPPDQVEIPDRKCFKQTLLSNETVPQAVAKFCEDRRMYGLEHVSCPDAVDEQKQERAFRCWSCGGGVCCGDVTLV